MLKDYVSVLRTGRTANWGSFKDEKDWAKAMEDEAFANSFTAAMDCRGVYLGAAVARLKRHTHLPIAVGFGISDPAQAAAVVRYADAAVVGSALIRKVAENLDSSGAAGTNCVSSVLSLVKDLAAGVSTLTAHQQARG